MRRFIILLAALTLALPLAAQERKPSHCFAIADASPELQLVQPAAFPAPPEDEFSVRLSYIGHSMYLLQSSGGLNVVTDYVGFIGGDNPLPDVVTMNIAHSSHWTPAPHPDIGHVLRGWKTPDGAPADYWLDLGEMLIRNVTTDIRSGFGERSEDNNSIFVFEVAGLCIGHLGHLHHEPSEETYAAIGRLDVVMAAVDGGYTVDLATMTRIIQRLRSSIVLPMHWFSGASLESFLDGISGDFAIKRMNESNLEISLRTLPSRPTIYVLQPRYLTADD